MSGESKKLGEKLCGGNPGYWSFDELASAITLCRALPGLMGTLGLSDSVLGSRAERAMVVASRELELAALRGVKYKMGKALHNPQLLENRGERSPIVRRCWLFFLERFPAEPLPEAGSGRGHRLRVEEIILEAITDLCFGAVGGGSFRIVTEEEYLRLLQHVWQCTEAATTDEGWKAGDFVEPYENFWRRFLDIRGDPRRASAQKLIERLLYHAREEEGTPAERSAAILELIDSACAWTARPKEAGKENDDRLYSIQIAGGIRTRGVLDQRFWVMMLDALDFEDVDSLEERQRIACEFLADPVAWVMAYAPLSKSNRVLAAHMTLSWREEISGTRLNPFAVPAWVKKTQDWCQIEAIADGWM